MQSYNGTACRFFVDADHGRYEGAYNMKCKHCGKIVKEDGYCPRCGEFVSQEGERVSLANIHARAQKKKTKLTKKQLWIRIGIISLAVLLALVIVVLSVVYAYLGRINRESEMSGDLHLNAELPTSDVQNIALFGTDSRQDNDSGRADAIIILSIDRKHGMIKLTSIARDSYVDIPGRGYDKLNHAYAFGKAPLTVKTINKNFDMNITDYVYVNFFEFVELIDYIGGIDLDVNTSEKNVMNQNYVPHLQKLGMDCPYITQTGMQHLNGAQALAYSRNRYTDGDTGRGNRHREVLEAMFVAVKDMPKSKLPSLVGQVLEMCHTTLSDGEMMGLAMWALTANPGFGSQSLPTKECNPRSGSAAMVNGVWYYIYDLDIATNILHTFIYEDDMQHFPTATRTMPRQTAAAGSTTATRTDETSSTIGAAASTYPRGSTAAPSRGTTSTVINAPTGAVDPSGVNGSTTSSTEPTGATNPSEIGDPTASTESPTHPTDTQPSVSTADTQGTQNTTQTDVSEPTESTAPTDTDPTTPIRE